MKLEAVFPQPIGVLPIVEVELCRQIGAPVYWTIILTIVREEHEDLSKLIAQLVEENLLQIDLQVVTDEGPVSLGYGGSVTDLSWKYDDSGIAGSDSAVIKISVTRPNEHPDPFIPRWRVHNVSKMSTLIQSFEHIAYCPQEVLNEIEQIPLSKQNGQETGYVIQAGTSDWDFFLEIIRQINMLDPRGRSALPLTLTGAINTEHEAGTRWIIVPGSRIPFERWQYIESRILEADEASLYSAMPYEYGTQFSVSKSIHSMQGCVPIVTRRYLRQNYTISEWNDWISRDLPLFVSNGENYVWKICDRLYMPGIKGDVEWEFSVSTIPKESIVLGPESGSKLGYWIGRGEVVETSEKGPWIKVRLYGFDKGMDTLQARIVTPFSGKNGRRGLHIVPAINTEVFLYWSGKFDDSTISIGNIRSEMAEFDAPSIAFDDKSTCQLSMVDILEVGQLRVGSEVDLKVAKKAKVEADKTTIELKGGTFYTGRS